VGLSSNLTFTALTDQTICEGSSTRLNLVSNANVFVWTPSAGLSNPSIADPVANPVITTQYIVRATLDRCFIEDTVVVTVNPAPVPDAGPAGFICYGQRYQLQGSGGVQYSWTPTAYLDNPGLANPFSTPDRTTTYTLSILADANGCPSLVTDTVTIDVTPPVKIYTFPADTIAYPGDQIRIRAVSAVPQANIFTWSPMINLDNPFISDPVYTAGPAGDSLVYKVTAASAAGCLGEGYVKVRVYKGPELYTPTAFTPNGDGLNDRFYPFPVGIKSINYFRVYNRWGQLVFSSNVLYKGWDGFFQGTKQATGVYVWMAQGVDKNNKLITRQGTITLIR
jgi:gliding motility-associated-like protein